MSSLASFTMIGIKQLQKHMDSRIQQLNNRRTVNAQAIAVIDRWIQKNFQTQGRLAHPGTGWKELSPMTIMMRRKGPKKTGKIMILQDTGTMRSRWKHFWDAWVAKIQAGVDYAYKHHFGKDNLPIRRILPSQKQIGPEIKKLYAAFVRKILK